MNELELAELRKLWIDAVITFERPNGSLALKPCWFADHTELLQQLGVDVGGCEGSTQGAHWLKRQRVEGDLGIQLRGAVFDDSLDEEFGTPRIFDYGELSELVALAAWDPRNGVPGCKRHHQRFDSQRMPPLVVPRVLVPVHVREFADDWGLETALELKHPQEVS